MKGFAALEAELALRREQHLYRSRLVIESPQGPEITIDGSRYLNFCSNDYLGLAGHPEIGKTMQRAIEECGVGSGASHLVNGHSRYHHALEEALAEYTGRPRALLFSTGYMANLGAVNALLGKGDAVFEDRLNHASLLDAGLLSGARFRRYRHGDVANLERQLAQGKAERQLIVSDGVFSMDGDYAPLPALVEVAQAHSAWVMVDDAHGLGCIGPSGGGVLEQFGLAIDQVQILVGTLGKAFGTAGAFVAGSEVLIETLIQQARTYIYTTAMPPAIAAATLTSLKIARQESWRRERLAELIHRFRSGATQLGLRLMNSETPIQPIITGSAERALQMSEALRSKGILVTAIRPPTVPAGLARLRVTFSAAHRPEQVDRLLDALALVTG